MRNTEEPLGFTRAPGTVELKDGDLERIAAGKEMGRSNFPSIDLSFLKSLRSSGSSGLNYYTDPHSPGYHDIAST
jgi:hypothetical protein